MLKFEGLPFVGFQVAVFGVVPLARLAIGTAYQMANDRLESPDEPDGSES